MSAKKYGDSVYNNKAKSTYPKGFFDYRKKIAAVPKTAVDKKLAKRIKDLEDDVEWKYADFYQAYTVIPSEGPVGTPVWTVHCLNTSTLGTEQADERIGTQIDTKMLHIRLSLLQNPANILDNRVRICIFWYKNSNSLLPTPSQFFDTSITVPTFAFYNDQFRESFKVIDDETHELKPLDWNGTNATIGDQISINKSFRLGRKTRYILGVGAGTYADILDNSLWIAIMTSANSGAAGVNNPQILVSTRCHYVDS